MPNYNEAQGVADLLSQFDFNDNNMDIEDFATEAQTAIQDAMDSPLYDALGSNACQIRATRSRPSPRLPKRAARHRASSNRTVMTGRRPSVRMSVPMGTLSIR